MDSVNLLEEFVVSFLADFLSGLLALLLGIPVGLWLDRILQVRNRKSLQKTVYHGLRDELLFNVRRMMDALVTCRPDGESIGFSVGYASSSAWMAIINGGQVGLLEDTKLLHLCLGLYRLVDRMNTDVRRLEQTMTTHTSSRIDIRDKRVVLRMLIGSTAREGIDLALDLLKLLDIELGRSPTEIPSLSQLLREWDSEQIQLSINHVTRQQPKK